MEILNEMYFGKTPELQQLEDIFEKLKIKYQKPSADNAQTFYKEVLNDSLLTQISEYIKAIFGFNEVIVTLRQEKKPTACTLSYLADIRGNAFKDTLEDKIPNETIKSSLIVTRDGMRFDPKHFSPNLLIILSSGLVFSPVISTSEIVAVLLHEIGHNFTKSIVTMDSLTDRADEKFADQFAAMYGYGPELNTALTKIVLKSKLDDYGILRKIPIVNIFAGLDFILSRFVNRTIFYEEHPGLQKRLEDTVRQLEADLNQTPHLTNKMRNEIKDQIKQCKIIINAYYNDKPYMTDRIAKYYDKNIEPKLWTEKSANSKAEKAAGSTVLNNQLRSRMGYFKKYNRK